jgi:16S rRNA (cytidine1402-2'-O)-methyltransferase
MNKGKLYIVATPIGNLWDMTYRAVEILKSVPFVLAEDTRESKKLFNRYEIKTQLISYRDQNHERMIEKILEKLNMGFSLALISDCGTPLISDPGYKLVRQLRVLGYDIESIPGPSAVVAGLSISGLATDKFTFLGFLPKTDSKREKLLELHGNLDSTLVIYESPHRLIKLLEVIVEVLGDRKVAVAKDLTKLREDFYFGNVKDVLEELRNKGFEDSPHGEFVVMVEGS